MASDRSALTQLVCPVCGRTFPALTTYAGHPGRTRTYDSPACSAVARNDRMRTARRRAARTRRRDEQRALEARGLLVPLDGMPVPG